MVTALSFLSRKAKLCAFYLNALLPLTKSDIVGLLCLHLDLPLIHLQHLYGTKENVQNFILFNSFFFPVQCQK
jgi:hypothetical protein